MRNSGLRSHVKPHLEESIPGHPQDDAENNVDLEIFQNFEDLRPRQQEWDEFISSLNGEIFLTFDWCRTWWKYYGANRELLIFVFRSHGDIVAILPVFAEKLRIGPSAIRAVKFVGSDHLPISFTVPIRPQFIDKVVLRFMDELSQHVKWDILHIGAICGRFDSFDDLLSSLEKTQSNRGMIRVTSGEVQTYFRLADSVEDYIVGLELKYQRKIRRYHRQIEKNNKILSSSFATAENVRDYFDSLVSMHQCQWRDAGQAGHFVDWPSSYDFHNEIAQIMARLGRLRLLKINIGSQCFGYQYAFKFSDYYCEFINARNYLKDFSSVSFSTVVFIEQARKALAENIKLIDSMRGTYSYKMDLGGQLLPIKNIFVYREHLVRISTFSISAWLLNLVYLKIWRRRLIPRLGLHPKPFWSTWIKSHVFAFCGLDKYFRKKL